MENFPETNLFFFERWINELLIVPKWQGYFYQAILKPIPSFIDASLLRAFVSKI
jgi:hypothetical protein